ncbi:MAG TPA: protein-disulfide reductase DsbD domain-containing protein, partial [Burkholderiaceae bacterium]
MAMTPWWPTRWASVAMLVPSLAVAQGAVLTTEHARAELLAHAPAGVAPGKPVWLALALQHQPHWHSYWRNPGDSGLPTTLSWQLGGAAVAGDIAWPTPQAIQVGPLINYGYEGALLLPVPLTIPAGFRASELRVKLQAEWLVCRDVCVPESGEFALTIPTRKPTSLHAKRFEAALAHVPTEPPSLQGRAAIERRALRVEVDGLPSALRGRELRFFAEAAGVVEHAAPVEQQWQAARWVARVPLSPQRSESP